MIFRNRNPRPSLIGIVLLFAAMQPILERRSAAQEDESRKGGLRLYDRFNGPTIDPTRWYAQYGCSTPTTMECVRQIENGALHLRARAYGDRSTNTGAEYGNSELYLADSAATDIAAKVTMLRADSQGCVTSPGGGTHGHALLFGTFFNGGGGTTNDDVHAFLVFDRYSTDPADLVQVSAFLQYQGTFFGFVVLGNVNVGEQVRAELKWDQPNHQFVARLKRPSDDTNVQVTLPYSISDSTPAVAPSKALGARSFPENCTGTQTFVDTEAAFDRVMVN
jgi:hypothetical protein